MTGKNWIAAALLASVAMAQTAIAQNDASGVSTVDASDLAVGTPEGGGAAAAPESYIAETHGDWEIRCLRVAEGQPEPCQLYQLLLDEGGSPVVEVNIFDVADEGQVVAGAQVVTPLDTLLPPQLRVRVDDGQALVYPFTFCQPFGCVVRIGLTPDDIDAFRRGGEATVSIVPLQAPDQLVDLTMSLTGFTDAFEALNERVIAAQQAAQEASE